MNSRMRQPVLVTGATGFIGGRLVRRLGELRIQTSCLVRTESGIAEFGPATPTLIVGDVTDPGSMGRALEDSQAGTVFHLAGLVRARRSSEFMRVNCRGAEIVAAACAARAPPPVLVLVSSLAAAGPSAPDRIRAESDPPAPVSQYGLSKLAGEQAVAAYAAAAPITIVRPPIVFGPGDRALLEVFRSIARWGVHIVPAPRPGGAPHGRVSLVHVDDLVECLLLAAETGERLRADSSSDQGVYFFAGDEHPTYPNLGIAIARSLGRKPPTVLRLPAPLLRTLGVAGDAIALLRGRPGWISSDKITEALAGSWTCSSAKARAQLGWSPEPISLPDRLQETAEWYRQQAWL